ICCCLLAYESARSVARRGLVRHHAMRLPQCKRAFRGVFVHLCKRFFGYRWKPTNLLQAIALLKTTDDNWDSPMGVLDHISNQTIPTRGAPGHFCGISGLVKDRQLRHKQCCEFEAFNLGLAPFLGRNGPSSPGEARLYKSRLEGL